MKTQRSTLLCPVCKQPLLKDKIDGQFEVWCGNGPCPSYTANNGAKGETEEEAFKQLTINIERDPR